MAAIQCPGCGAYLSVKGLVVCPRCQHDLSNSRVDAGVIMSQNQKASDMSQKPGDVSRELIGVIALLLLAVGILFVGWKIFSPSEEKRQKELVSKALLGCQYAIKSMAKFGDAELPPYVQNYGKSGEYYFAWPSGSFHFVNGFGAKEKMSASCIGDLNTGKITSLTLNGRDVN